MDIKKAWFLTSFFVVKDEKFIYFRCLVLYMEDTQLRSLLRKRKNKKAFSETIKYLTKDELKRLFDVVDNVRDKAIIHVLYSSGGRVGELSKAFVDDFDLTSCFWYIPASNTKTKKERKPRINTRAISDLKAYLKAYGISKGKVFPLSVRAMQFIIKKYAVRAGLGWVHPHTLRHTHIIHALQAGVSINAVQKQVGHIDLRTTQIYSSLSVSDVGKAYEGVDV